MDAWLREPETASAPRGIIARMRRVLPFASGAAEMSDEEPATVPERDADAAAPNDLRSYLRRKATLQSNVSARPKLQKERERPKMRGSVGPLVRSLDALVTQIRARPSGTEPCAVLLVPASRDVDATSEAISVARALSRREHAILVDVTRGSAAISGPLGLPRAPGFTELVSGRAGFEDVVQADEASKLQIIPAGNPHAQVSAGADDAARFIEALSQVYNQLVLHTDRDTLRKLEPALEGRLHLIVAVLAPGDTLAHDEASIAEIRSLGCGVLPFEQTGGGNRPRRAGLFGRAGAV
jgi:Mrp family chromosome partitioning ATPase